VGTASGKPREEIATRLAQHIDTFKGYGHPHARLMADLAARLAQRLGLAPTDINAIAEAALLHDIGLYQMSPAYISSTGPLSLEERIDLWRHPIIGEQEMAKRGSSRHAQLLVRWHHEWWNGTGYPDMLSFEQIPIGARIIRAVELYRALVSDRPYRPRQSEHQARETLRSSAGIQCDPYVVTALLAFLDEVDPLSASDQSLASTSGIVPSNAAASAQESGPSAPEVEGTLSETLNEADSAAQGAFVDPSASIEHPGGVGAQPSIGLDQNVGHQENVRPPPNQVAESEQGRPTMALESAHGESAQPVGPDQPASAQPQIGLAPGPGLTNSLNSAHEPMGLGGPEVLVPGHSQQSVSLGADQSAHADASDTFRGALGGPGLGWPTASSGQTPVVSPEDATHWRAWLSSPHNTKSLLGFQASVLRQIEFRSVAIACCGWARLVWYLKAWGKQILSNDPRSWAAAVSRAVLESPGFLDEEQISWLVQDLYVPGTRLANPSLRKWFGETDSWWIDNLRRKIDQADASLKDRALLFGLMTGDYAQSFKDDTADLKRPLTTVFKQLAISFPDGFVGHPSNRSYNSPMEDFVGSIHADLLFLNLIPGQSDVTGPLARSGWREIWVGNGAGSARVGGADANAKNDVLSLATRAQSKQTYLAVINQLLVAGGSFRKWAIECRDIGVASATDVAELVKQHRPVRAIYSKDLTEVAGGLRHYIIIAERE
jgi:hypothetical protein